MKTRILCFTLVAAALASLPASARDDEARPPVPESAMAACSAEAKSLKGEERQQFMSRCLKSDAAKPVRQARADDGHGQQGRMKSCNEEAGKKALKGDERRAFMSACLKKG